MATNLLAKRVGARGSSRLGVLRHVLDGVDLHGECDLGLDESALHTLAYEFHFDALASAIPTRGDRARLVEIAWFGSAVADIASAGADAWHDGALRDGALFNLGVALVDSVLDDRHDARARALAARLAPEQLRGCLLGQSRLDGPGPIREIGAVFHAALRGIGERWRHDRSVLTQIETLLIRMYRSEMTRAASRADAKRLPVAFIGVVSDHGYRLLVHETVDRLGCFVALLDDWQDLGDDLMTGRANLFVHDRDLGARTAAARLLSCSRLLVRHRRSIDQIGRRLRDALDVTLLAAELAGREVELKTHAFLRHLLLP
ncbi:hypothetical protein [Frankia sp. Cj3]|uniref:hypothetical protein n=1 Tax=Frankia sp. Cj3 TaxID=2880976 RepID=UPI001EF52588|nr:hypothetical protein [Frankia sp. Cj3]